MREYKGKMKCKKGHTLTYIPFNQSGLYCHKCTPETHDYYQKIKTEMVANMRAGRKKAQVVSLLNRIAKV